jgi:hypothetical protein
MAPHDKPSRTQKAAMEAAGEAVIEPAEETDEEGG